MQRLLRIFTIIRVVARYRLDNLIDRESLPWYGRLILSLLPWRYIKHSASRGARLRMALTDLGPIFVKFGQILSTRRDLLPGDVGDELAQLQDRVPAFSSDVAVSIIEKSLGESVDNLFQSFEREPMASASIAQVHGAVLHNPDNPRGDDVVVKVIRPGIAKTIRKDISLLFMLARIVRLTSDGKRLRPVEVVADYESTIFDELNLQREAANASQLRRNFLESHLLYVPRVYWEFSRPKVMVMERIYGIPVTDMDALKEQGTNMKLLAERGVETFFTQVFRDSFFHADMHPGNIFISRSDPRDPQYIGIDCGIVGSLAPEDQSYLARNLLAFFRRDYRMVAQLHIDSGWVPADTRVNELEAGIRTVCEPIFEKPLAEISFGMVLLNLFQVARRFNMEVQPQLVLLQKTLLNIEGLGRQLYPQLDLWATAQPFLEKWMHERVAPQSVIKRLHNTMPEMIEQAPMLAHQLFEDVQALRRSKTGPCSVSKPAKGKDLRWLGVLVLGGALVMVEQASAVADWNILLLGGVGGYLLSQSGTRKRSDSD
ncbi:ubiquinone biosynthesis regulatory protein kinase UbiB [Sansalvadorimonas verongulae]|uniref:ubiquinone biosynthesis regulatory protein kinase UbiB n=1 Tax=Sansalvadorimonas verongulae TaxID=2172824 RepID=UPI002E3718E2|nr:ubiquinone biosynthesis regulatory protein kinase UbiB [Sansalvadorimonas verongulae]MTI15491.1 ubiquinone biosynthesis regulatory protein kinase UbiB [Sansalvadorimonas verongulae]